MAKKFSLVLGVVLVLLGIAGFITGSHDHKLLAFGINASHNVVHILSGALAIVAGLAGERQARVFCIVFGVVYGLVALAGFLNIGAIVRLLNLNRADDFLHLGVAASCLIVGAISAKRPAVVSTAPKM